MNEKQSDLLLIDTALVGWPEKHLMPDGFPAADSRRRVREARMYLNLYNGEKAKKDLSWKWNLPARVL